MQVVFDTKPLAAAMRRQAWRDAICEIYLQVDCAAEQDGEYAGFVREARFGDVILTDTLLSPQSIRRQSHHLARSNKDCYYAGIEQMGNLTICQAGSTFLLRPGVGTVYYANEPYELHCNAMSRQFWIELPRQAFDSRFDSGRPPFSPISILAAAWAASPSNSAPSWRPRMRMSILNPRRNLARSSWTSSPWL